jgi:hypothetical protein
MLSLLILGKESMKNDNIDVYLEPLVEELETLWKRVTTIDVTRVDGSQTFLLKAICVWNIHDYLAYGLFAGCQVKGYMACPICGPNVNTQQTSHLKKNVYQGHRQYLDKNHPYQKNRVAFNGQPKQSSAPTRVFTIEFLKKVEE